MYMCFSFYNLCCVILTSRDYIYKNKCIQTAIWSVNYSAVGQSTLRCLWFCKHHNTLVTVFWSLQFIMLFNNGKYISVASKSSVGKELFFHCGLLYFPIIKLWMIICRNVLSEKLLVKPPRHFPKPHLFRCYLLLHMLNIMFGSTGGFSLSLCPWMFWWSPFWTQIYCDDM